jgi:hypothetical protein
MPPNNMNQDPSQSFAVAPGAEQQALPAGEPAAPDLGHIAVRDESADSEPVEVTTPQAGEPEGSMAQLAAMRAEAAQPTPMGETPTISGGSGRAVREQAAWAGPRGSQPRESEGHRFKYGE